ncbi:MAG: sugar-binding domain-containing protein [Acidimicrobiales bacterium]|jgi:DNA-binding transcriptional regulator LsrR (DeoR family)
MSGVDAEVRMMLKACHQYYRRGLTHTEIATNLGITRFAVARLLRTATEDGFVTVKILEPESLHLDLEDAIEALYGTRAAIVVDSAELKGEEAKQSVADAAGRYLTQVVADGDVLGVSLGSTIQALIDQLPGRIPKQAEVVQLVGGHSTILCAQLAERFKTRPHLLHAPAVVGEKAVRDLLLADQEIQATAQMFDQVSIAVLGIGALTGEDTSRLLSGGLIDARLRRNLLSRGAVGDVLSYVFDGEGHVLQSGLEDRLMAIPLDQYLKIPHRIGVAAGIVKAAAISAALRGGFINVIVIDSLTAEAILERSEADETPAWGHTFEVHAKTPIAAE